MSHHSLARAALSLALLLPFAPAPAAAAQEPAAAAETSRARQAEALQRLGVEARPFFEEHLPPALRRPGPAGLLWWQWLGLPLVVIVAYVLGSLLGWATRRALGHLAARTRTNWDDLLLDRVAGPLTAMWGLGVITLLSPWLMLSGGAEAGLERILRALTYLVVFWAGFRAVEVAFSALAEAPWTRTNAGLVGLLPLGRKVSKLVLLAIGAVAVLSELGFQVASLLAGLGIGGIALALAAQKTVENLFGSLAIGVDQPFRVGDFVKVEDVSGTVEAIGMRSTRIRTQDRTLVTIPNGKLADTRTETFAARDRCRLFVNLGLAYDTSAAQMKAVLEGVEAALRAEPKFWSESCSVRFTEFRDSSLNVEVVAWFTTTDWAEFTRIRQALYLRFMEVVEQAGTSFAFPTRTVELVDGRQASRPGGRPPQAPV
ncbi:MAG: mechanosensitive ion channel family protein [Anaeromyxobacter sp.]